MPTRAALRRRIPVIAGTAAVLAVVIGLAWLAKQALDHQGPPQKKTVQQVTVIRPPPLPDQPPPPPPQEQEKVELPKEPPPEPAPDEQPPPGEQLGLDAEGSAGGDAFGLAARKGGRDLIGSDSGDRFSWYRGVLTSDLAGRLAENRKIRRSRYSVKLRLWVAADGRIEKVMLDSSTGNSDLDRSLERAFAELDRVSEVPPAGLPRPVRLRIASRI